MSKKITYAAHAGAILALGLPLIGSHLAQMALHVTDTVLLGRYGVTELAAVVLGTAFFFILFIFGAGFGTAVMSLVAASLGRGDEVQVRRDTRMGLWLVILFGLLTYPLMWWSGTILRALGQAPDVSAHSQAFLRIAGLGMIPALVVMTLKGFLAALGRTSVVLWVTVMAAVVNGILGWLLVFGHYGFPELGVRGTALGSLMAQTVSAAVLAFYAHYQRDARRFRLFGRFWRADWPTFFSVLKLGWPIGITGVAEGGLFQASALMMGWIGTVELAAHGIALEITALSFMVHLGLSNAATIRAGRAEGERDVVSLRDGAVTAIAMSVLVGLVMVTLFLTSGHLLVGLYLDAARPGADRILAFAVHLLTVAALFQMFDAMQCMALGLLRGLRDTTVPMIIAGCSYWVIGIPASWYLAFRLDLGGEGLWFGLVAGLALASVLLMLRFWRDRYPLFASQVRASGRRTAGHDVIAPVTGDA